MSVNPRRLDSSELQRMADNTFADLVAILIFQLGQTAGEYLGYLANEAATDAQGPFARHREISVATEGEVSRRHIVVDADGNDPGVLRYQIREHTQNDTLKRLLGWLPRALFLRAYAPQLEEDGALLTFWIEFRDEPDAGRVIRRRIQQQRQSSKP